MTTTTITNPAQLPDDLKLYDDSDGKVTPYLRDGAGGPGDAWHRLGTYRTREAAIHAFERACLRRWGSV
jgi:hypothetical protein